MAGILDPPSPGPVPRGRRRAGSRHRRTRRLPSPRAALLRLGVPVAVLLLIGALVAVAWAVGGDRRGPLPPALTLTAALLTATLVFAVAWRARLSPLAALVAAALAALSPPVVLAMRVGVPEHLAVVALLTSALLLLARSRRRILVPVAAVAAGIAAALAPLALAAAPFLAWQAARALTAHHRIPTLPLAGALFFATTAAGLAVIGVDPTVTRVAGAALLTTWLRDAPLVLAVGAAAIALGLLTRPLQPVAGYALTLLALSVWPDGDDVVRYSVLLAPALGLLTAAATERALLALRAFLPRTRLLGAIGAAAVGAALLTAVAASAAHVSDRAASGDSAAVPASPSPSPSPSPSAPPTSARPTPVPDRDARAALGAELVRNPRLTLEEPARALLLDGAVDRRIPIVLAQLLGEHDLTVADFPAVSGEDPSVRRSVLVEQMDGELLRTEGAPMTALTSFLAALTGTFAVETISVSGDGVLATFPPSP